MKRYLPFFAAICSVVILSSCKTDSPVQSTSSSSFQKLQEKVLAKTCIGCHTQNTDYALQSGLILDATVAYNNLVGVPSHYPNAKADGILRVKPGYADSSLLYLKIHGIPQGKDYGLQMPLGFSALSIGQQEFIRKWINAGAPQTGIVAPDSLLDDTTHYPAPDFTPLPPPAPGTGFQVTSSKFDVGANFEREIFVYRDLGNSTPIYVNHIHTKMRPNSHHLVLYSFDPNTPKYEIPQLNVIRDLRNPDGSIIPTTEDQMIYHLFLGGSMIQEDDYNFPAGVALQLPPHAGIDFNTHFINHTSSTIPGECFANFYTTNPTGIQHLAQSLFLVNTDINLPAGQQTVLTQTTPDTSSAPLHIFLLTSHYHERGVLFQIAISGGSRNGEIVYESTDWSHPLEKTFDPPIILNRGEGLKTIVTYNNTTDHT
ncbi:MAG: hypothetical protein ACHQM6_08850, partial [Candidatus Kapaibacterium sp.]